MTVPVDLSPTLCVGDRVTVSGDRGFVRYIGELPGQKGVWIGIDWDDCSRGKHNGSLKGTQYFTTRHPASGSFVRQQQVSGGNDILSEIRDRYEDVGDVEDNVHMGRLVTKVGMEKIHKRMSKISTLTVVSLTYMNVARPPPADTTPFKKCTQLNLHGNLLHRWRDVFDILHFFPALRELVLSKNWMEELRSTDSLPSVSAPIQDLVLNDCHVSEDTVRAVLDRLPKVTNLHLFRNDLSSFDPGPSGMHLQSLDLEKNHIDSFEKISKLAKLPELSYLVLNDCGLKCVVFDSSDCGFSRLHTLSLKGNPISDWESVNSLGRLPSLEVLHIDSDQFPVAHGIDAREVLIAKLPSVTMLNRGDVSVVERRSSEIRYLAKYSALPDCERIIHEDDLKRLTKIHGPPPTSTLKKGMKTARLNIEYKGNTINRPLPLSLTVSRLRDMICRLFPIECPEDVCLHVDRKGQIVPLDVLSRPLSFFSLEDGECIRIV